MGNSLKARFFIMMSKMMISCNKASYLTSKKEDGKLSWLESMELKMHLLSCKFCRRYEKEIQMINRFVHHQNEIIWNNRNGSHLSEKDKIMLKNLIQSELKKK